MAKEDGAPVNIEFEGSILRSYLLAVEPDDLKAPGGHLAYGSRHPPLGQVLSVVAQIQSAQADGLVGRIVEFYPPVEVERRTYKLIDIGRHHLVDDERSRRTFIGGDGILATDGQRSCSNSREHAADGNYLSYSIHHY